MVVSVTGRVQLGIVIESAVNTSGKVVSWLEITLRLSTFVLGAVFLALAEESCFGLILLWQHIIRSYRIVTRALYAQ